MPHGFNGFIGMTRQTDLTTVGPAVGTTTRYQKAMSEGFSVSFDRFETINIHNGYYEPDDESGIGRVSGSITAPGHPDTLSQWLKAAFTTASQTNVVSGYIHLLTHISPTSNVAADAAVHPYTITVGRDITSMWRYVGCCMQNMAISFAPNQDVRLTSQWIGYSAGLVTGVTPTFPGSPATGFNFSTASISVGGSASSAIEALTVTIDNQIEGIPALNNSTNIVRVVRRGPQTIRLSGTMHFSDITEYQNFINQTEQRFVINCTKTASFIFSLDMPRVVYTSYPVMIPGRDRILVNFEGRARYHTGSGTAIEARVSTTQSGW